MKIRLSLFTIFALFVFNTCFSQTTKNKIASPLNVISLNQLQFILHNLESYDADKFFSKMGCNYMGIDTVLTIQEHPEYRLKYISNKCRYEVGYINKDKVSVRYITQKANEHIKILDAIKKRYPHKGTEIKNGYTEEFFGDEKTIFVLSKQFDEEEKATYYFTLVMNKPLYFKYFPKKSN
jgi:hypothetical protein